MTTDQGTLALYCCRVCGVDLEYLGVGRPPVVCVEHRPKSWPVRRGNNATRQQLNGGVSDAAKARDEAMARVDDHAPDEWKLQAWAFIVGYLETHATMHVDDLWAGLTAPREARALGPIIQRAVREGLIERSGDYAPSVRSHLSMKPVWRSCIHDA